MNDIHQSEGQEFVPEVDAASLQAAQLPNQSQPVAPAPHSVDASTEQPAPTVESSSVDADSPKTLPDDPAQAMQALPPALTAHIHDLIAEADAAGYLRGRNEQIESMQHFDDADDDCDLTPSPMPRYNRRSIWDA